MPMDGVAAGQSAQSPQPGADATALQQALLQQQQIIASLMASQQQLQAQMQQPQAHIDLPTLAALLQQQQEAAQRQQRDATAQMLSLQALGQLPTFTGKGTSALAANEWVSHAERYFTAREEALGISAAAGDAMRTALAANAMQDDAQRWYTALPAADRPARWDEFKKALLGRYSSVPAVRVRVEQLRSFVDAARRLRDRMTLEGLQGYTSRFQQLANEIPDTHLTTHGKLELLARGLAPRLAEAVLTEDAKERPAALHTIVATVLAKAAFKEYAGGISGSSSSTAAGRVDAMDTDAISLCAAQFGVSREEAARYVEPGEGWAPHDTGAPAPAPARSFTPSASPTSVNKAQLEELMLAAFQRFSASATGASGSGSGSQGKAQSQRRNVPRGLHGEIPEALLDARKAAGLCIKCGVAKYEPGGKGHNARTCTAAVDKTTSTVEGKKKAGF